MDTSPSLRMCDAHIHIFDALKSGDQNVFPNSTVADYLKVQKVLGTQRTVVVQPRAFGTDNTCILDAVARLGLENTRGIVVVDPSISYAELREMDRQGVRGIRFSLFTPRHPSKYVPQTSPASLDDVLTMARRVEPLGWHIQLNWSADQIHANRQLLDEVPTPIVFDHFARLTPELGMEHPAFGDVMKIIDKGAGWVKIAAPYLDSRTGRDRDYDDMLPIAQGWVAAAPERLVWGSDWPHPSAENALPDDATLRGLLARWVPDEAVRTRILIDNPEKLYGF
jgi:D-galactarolactone isomerase